MSTLTTPLPHIDEGKHDTDAGAGGEREPKIECRECMMIFETKKLLAVHKSKYCTADVSELAKRLNVTTHKKTVQTSILSHADVEAYCNDPSSNPNLGKMPLSDLIAQCQANNRPLEEVQQVSFLEILSTKIEDAKTLQEYPLQLGNRERDPLFLQMDVVERENARRETDGTLKVIESTLGQMRSQLKNLQEAEPDHTLGDWARAEHAATLEDGQQRLSTLISSMEKQRDDLRLRLYDIGPPEAMVSRPTMSPEEVDRIRQQCKKVEQQLIDRNQRFRDDQEDQIRQAEWEEEERLRREAEEDMRNRPNSSPSPPSSQRPTDRSPKTRSPDAIKEEPKSGNNFPFPFQWPMVPVPLPDGGQTMLPAPMPQGPSDEQMAAQARQINRELALIREENEMLAAKLEEQAIEREHAAAMLKAQQRARQTEVIAAEVERVAKLTREVRQVHEEREKKIAEKEAEMLEEARTERNAERERVRQELLEKQRKGGPADYTGPGPLGKADWAQLYQLHQGLKQHQDSKYPSGMDAVRRQRNDAIGDLVDMRHQLEAATRQRDLMQLRMRADREERRANRTQWLITKKNEFQETERLKQMVPPESNYDPIEGFILELVNISGLAAGLTEYSLKACFMMYRGPEAITPMMETEVCTVQYSATLAVRVAQLNFIQKFARLGPTQTTRIILEVQSVINGRVVQALGWAMIPLFTKTPNLVDGSFETPLFAPPMQPEATPKFLRSLTPHITPGLRFRVMSAAPDAHLPETVGEEYAVMPALKVPKTAGSMWGASFQSAIPEEDEEQALEEAEVKAGAGGYTDAKSVLDIGGTAAPVTLEDKLQQIRDGIATAAIRAKMLEKARLRLTNQRAAANAALAEMQANQDKLGVHEESVAVEETWLPPPAWRDGAPTQKVWGGERVVVVIDAARFLADGITVSIVTVDLLNPNGMSMLDQPMRAVASLSSPLHSPVFATGMELSMEDWDPYLTLHVRIDTLDPADGTTNTTVGQLMHPLFLDKHTGRQPLPPSRRRGTHSQAHPTAPFHLNTGLFQLPLRYGKPPVGAQINSATLASLPRIPCSTLLMRVLLVDPAESNWASPGLPTPPPVPAYLRGNDSDPVEVALAVTPLYSQGVYDSSVSAPSGIEHALYRVRAAAARADMSVRDIVPFVLTSSDFDAIKEYSDDELRPLLLLKFQEVSFNKAVVQSLPLLDMLFFAKYHTRIGFKVSVDAALNLPLPSGMVGSVVFAVFPPQSYFMDTRLRDNAYFVGAYDFNSQVMSPRFNDGWVDFRDILPRPNASLLFNIVAVGRPKKKSATPPSQWLGFAALPLFASGPVLYVQSGSYQLPLYELKHTAKGEDKGFMPHEIVHAAGDERGARVDELLQELAESKRLQPLQPSYTSYSSILIRVEDNQHGTIAPSNQLENADLRYIPAAKRGKYAKLVTSKPLKQLHSEWEKDTRAANREINLALQTVTGITAKQLQQQML